MVDFDVNFRGKIENKRKQKEGASQFCWSLGKFLKNKVEFLHELMSCKYKLRWWAIVLSSTKMMLPKKLGKSLIMFLLSLEKPKRSSLLYITILKVGSNFFFLEYHLPLTSKETQTQTLFPPFSSLFPQFIGATFEITKKKSTPKSIYLASQGHGVNKINLVNTCAKNKDRYKIKKENFA